MNQENSIFDSNHKLSFPSRLHSFEYALFLIVFLLSFFSGHVLISGIIGSIIKTNSEVLYLGSQFSLFISTFPVFVFLFHRDLKRIEKEKTKRLIYSRMFVFYSILVIISLYLIFSFYSFINSLFDKTPMSVLPWFLSSLIVFIPTLVYLFNEIKSFESRS